MYMNTFNKDIIILLLLLLRYSSRDKLANNTDTTIQSSTIQVRARCYLSEFLAEVFLELNSRG